MSEVLNQNAVTDECKEQVRITLASLYDMQKLRISVGNRIVSSFYMKLGIKPSEKPDDADEEVQSLIQTLRREYKGITEAIMSVKEDTGKQVRVQTIVKKLNDGKEPIIKYIVDDYDYKLMESYERLALAEEDLLKVLQKHVEAHPLWDRFFKNVKGCGPTMAAVCLAYLDPYKARHVSSFFKYAGVDVVQNKDEDGEFLFLAAKAVEMGDLGKPILQRTNTVLRRKFIYRDAFGDVVEGKASATDRFNADGEPIFVNSAGEELTKEYVTKMIDGVETPVYEVVETGEEYIGHAVRYEHGRRKGDCEWYDYVDKNGEMKKKRGITYNPTLKSKLLGVLSGCILKAKDEHYAPIYYDYRSRLDNSAWHLTNGTTDAAKHKMAIRYMIIQFLRDLWISWRQLEGLEVDAPYEVAKLGHKPHKYNERQAMIAVGSKIL